MTDGDPNNASGTHLLSDINLGVGDSGVGNYVAFNGELFFSAFDPVNGNEIRHTDGTNVQLFMDINPGVNGSSFHGSGGAEQLSGFSGGWPELRGSTLVHHRWPQQPRTSFAKLMAR